MKAEDFVYDGISLSSFGYMIADFEDSSGLGSVDTDSQRSFNNFSLFDGKWQPLSVSTYRDTLKITLSIMRNPCQSNETIIPLTEIRQIKRWLNRPTYHKIRLITNNGEFDHIFWKGSANVEEVHHMGECVGFNITFYTDRPFALSDEIVFSGDGSELHIVDVSDEEGYIYPDVELVVSAAGDLKITNDFDDREIIINNCSQGETITMTNTLQISTDNTSHKIADDFNWKFLRICNNFYNATNNITFSLPCQYTIKYNPIVKAVIA